MSVQSESRWKKRTIAQAQSLNALTRELEVFVDGRDERPTVAYVPPIIATSREARRWMRLHAHEYETATELAEACNAALPLPPGAMDENGWAWDLALEAQP